MLQLQAFTFNPFQENTWLVWNDQNDCIIIDPGCYSAAEKEILRDFIESRKLRPVRLINTHCHIDHVLGNPFVERTWGLKPQTHRAEKALLDAIPQYGQMWGINSETQPEPEYNMQDLTEIELGAEKLKVLFTPGHSPGEICLYSEQGKFVIAGDVLFRESIGRTDLPGGNYETLIESIRNELFTLPDDTEVHPGHGPSTTIGHEKKYNPFLS
ncbi:MAG: MBL fold metallo-hydrolase [Bacteroidia bacterium]